MTARDYIQQQIDAAFVASRTPRCCCELVAELLNARTGDVPTRAEVLCMEAVRRREARRSFGESPSWKIDPPVPGEVEYIARRLPLVSSSLTVSRAADLLLWLLAENQAKARLARRPARAASRPGPASPQEPDMAEIDNFETYLLQLINDARANAGARAARSSIPSW